MEAIKDIFDIPTPTRIDTIKNKKKTAGPLKEYKDPYGWTDTAYRAHKKEIAERNKGDNQ